MSEKQEVGKITHFFPKISVAIVALSSDLKVGDKISIKGHGNIVEQEVESMQINHEQVEEAKAGDNIGLMTKSVVKENDIVYKENDL